MTERPLPAMCPATHSSPWEKADTYLGLCPMGAEFWLSIGAHAAGKGPTGICDDHLAWLRGGQDDR